MFKQAVMQFYVYNSSSHARLSSHGNKCSASKAVIYERVTCFLQNPQNDVFFWSACGKRYSARRRFVILRKAVPRSPSGSACHRIPKSSCHLFCFFVLFVCFVGKTIDVIGRRATCHSLIISSPQSRPLRMQEPEWLWAHL